MASPVVIASMAEPETYSISVRALCEFGAKQGDLDLRFTPSPTSAQGIAGHRTVASRRSKTYRREVSLRGQYLHLNVRGRADGYDCEQQLLEEVKTFKGSLDNVPDNHRRLHWAQAMVYGALLCREQGLSELNISVVYFEVDSQQEAPLPERRSFSATELDQFFEALCERFMSWAAAELNHRKLRDVALAALRFPHEEFRPGQRDLAKGVFNAARLGRCLLVQAPTGIGKTIGTIFPMLKAMPGQELDKVFFLTAKTTGRSLALDALATISRDQDMPLRVIELVAREKSCEHPDKACHGESCPLAKGFYDRLPAARRAAAAATVLTREPLRDIALAHSVCPYYLAQEMTKWSDVVVGDFNHYFDGNAMLHGLTTSNNWRVAVLVDEAHNLLDRARAMYSISLDAEDLRHLRQTAPVALKRPLERLQRNWSRMIKPLTQDYTVLESPPEAFVAALKDASVAIGEHLGKSFKPGVANLAQADRCGRLGDVLRVRHGRLRGP